MSGVKSAPHGSFLDSEGRLPHKETPIPHVRTSTLCVPNYGTSSSQTEGPPKAISIVVEAYSRDGRRPTSRLKAWLAVGGQRKELIRLRGNRTDGDAAVCETRRRIDAIRCSHRVQESRSMNTGRIHRTKIVTNTYTGVIYMITTCAILTPLPCPSRSPLDLQRTRPSQAFPRALSSAFAATNAINAAPTPDPSFAIPILILFSPFSPSSGISRSASRIQSSKPG